MSEVHTVFGAGQIGTLLATYLAQLAKHGHAMVEFQLEIARRLLNPVDHHDF